MQVRQQHRVRDGRIKSSTTPAVARGSSKRPRLMPCRAALLAVASTLSLVAAQAASPPPSPSSPPSPPLECLRVCQSMHNGARDRDMLCFKAHDATCFPIPYNGQCQSDRTPCYPLGTLGTSSCVDVRAPRKCARKVARGRCHKERVANKCASSCGLCAGVPPPSPSPPWNSYSGGRG